MYLHQIYLLVEAFFSDEIRPFAKQFGTKKKRSKIKQLRSSDVAAVIPPTKHYAHAPLSHAGRFFWFFLHLLVENLFNALLLLISQ